MSKTISFQQYVEKHARARGDAAKSELTVLKKKIPLYKNDKQYLAKFPIVFGRYQAYVKRGTQSKKAA